MTSSATTRLDDSTVLAVFSALPLVPTLVMAARFSVETALSMLDASFSDDVESDSVQELEDMPISGGGANTSHENVELDRASNEGRDHETGGVGLESDQDVSDTDQSSPEDPPKSRKRVRKPDKWKKTKRVKRRNSGKPYSSTSGKQVRYH